jgi:hypothetical protein
MFGQPTEQLRDDHKKIEPMILSRLAQATLAAGSLLGLRLSFGLTQTRGRSAVRWARCTPKLANGCDTFSTIAQRSPGRRSSKRARTSTTCLDSLSAPHAPHAVRAPPEASELHTYEVSCEQLERPVDTR